MSSPRRGPGRRSAAIVVGSLVAAVVIATILVVAARPGGGAGSPPPDPVVARVGADEIRQSALDGRVQIALVAAIQGGAPQAGTPQYAAFLGQIRARALKSLIQDEVIAQEAATRGVGASDADIEREVSADTQAAGGSDALQSQLATAGSSIAQLRDETRARLNEAQLEDFFARQRADDALAQLRTGTPWETVATALSDDDTSRPSGGDLGSLALDTLRAGNRAFFDAVMSLAVGATTSQPIRDSAGYEILRVDAATPTARSVHRILVAAPQPYTEKERPQWFTQAVLLALSEECSQGRIVVVVGSAGQPCDLGGTLSPSAAATGDSVPAVSAAPPAPTGTAAGSAPPAPGLGITPRPPPSSSAGG